MGDTDRLYILHREKEESSPNLSDITKLIFPLAKGKKVEYLKGEEMNCIQIYKNNDVPKLRFWNIFCFQRRKGEKDE